jgi:hypothetical protein
LLEWSDKIENVCFPKLKPVRRRWIWRPGWAISAIGLLAFLSMMFIMGLEIGQYLQNLK